MAKFEDLKNSDNGHDEQYEKYLDISVVSSGTPPHKCGGLTTRIK